MKPKDDDRLEKILMINKNLAYWKARVLETREWYTQMSDRFHICRCSYETMVIAKKAYEMALRKVSQIEKSLGFTDEA